MTDTLGIIGVGHFAGFLVAGLCRDVDRPEIVLSPHNAVRARTLAATHDAAIASDNEEVVRRSDLVILATRPAQVLEAAHGLPWRREQAVICVAAGTGLTALRAACAPAEAVLALPVSSAAIGESPTLLYPGGGRAERFLARFGSVHTLPDAESFRAACVHGAYYGWLYAIMAQTADWMARHGVPAAMARELAAGALRGAGGMALQQSDRSLDELLESLATPGGITQAGLEALNGGKVFDHWIEACDTARDRMRGMPEPSDD